MTDKSSTYELLVEEETLIADAAELICQLLERDGISRQDLATRLGKTKGFVSQLLTGERNMTLRTLASVLFVLGHRFELAAKPLSAARTYPTVLGTAAAGQQLDARRGGSHNHHEVWRYVAAVAESSEKPKGIERERLLFASLQTEPQAGGLKTGSQVHDLQLARERRRRAGDARSGRDVAGRDARDLYRLVGS